MDPLLLAANRDLVSSAGRGLMLKYREVHRARVAVPNLVHLSFIRGA